MAKLVRAPEQIDLDLFTAPKIFLAGSIDMGRAIEWQKQVEDSLKDEDVIIFNPRRTDFDANQQYASNNPYMVEQIHWELKHLDVSDLVVFYFDPKGLAPITLYEYGRMSYPVSTKQKRGLVCCEEGFWKKPNIDISINYDSINFDNTFETASNLEEFKKRIKEIIQEIVVK